LFRFANLTDEINKASTKEPAERHREKKHSNRPEMKLQMREERPSIAASLANEKTSSWKRSPGRRVNWGDVHWLYRRRLHENLKKYRFYMVGFVGHEVASAAISSCLYRLSPPTVRLLHWTEAAIKFEAALASTVLLDRHPVRQLPVEGQIG
jgi:hypothetical protein